MSCGYVNSQANFNMPCGHFRIYVDGKDQLWTKTKYVGFQGKCPHTQVKLWTFSDDLRMC